MLEVSVERLIFAPSERLWKELSPQHLPAWTQMGVQGAANDAFTTGASVTLSMRRLFGAQKIPAQVTVDAGKKLKFTLQGARTGDEIEWILHSKNNSTRVAVVERFASGGLIPPLTKAKRRRRHERALRALELRTTGEEVSPLYVSR